MKENGEETQECRLRGIKVRLEQEQSILRKSIFQKFVLKQVFLIRTFLPSFYFQKQPSCEPLFNDRSVDQVSMTEEQRRFEPIKLN